MKAKSALSLALAAGIASTAAASNTPTELTPTAADIRDGGHIYYNIATGERVITNIDNGQTSPADTGESVLLWSVADESQCIGVDALYTTTWYFAVDDNSPTTMGGPATPLSTMATFMDYGDIALDTVVDCVSLDWVTAHEDIEGPDGGGEGVPGLGGLWTYWDAENGGELDNSTRLPIISFLFIDLPGNIFGPDAATQYTADVDLVSTFTGTDLTFEIGDSDSDLQGASFHNADVANQDRNFDGQPDSDLDGDGLFDWGWSVQFFQPGTADLDDDGVIDGDIADSMQGIGVSFGMPVGGTAVQDAAGEWDIEIDPTVPGAATGAEEGFVLFETTAAGDLIYGGNFFFGGFACEGVPLDQGGPGYVPRADFFHSLWGPNGDPQPEFCDADINEDGNLNFFDLSQFVQAFNNMEPAGDFNDDGQWNFFDLSAFIQAFNNETGCP